ncbi:MAG: DNA internalization-related competence protein ComEC/Rec2 [Gammaproteobacteria bacterium]|nr:DNA internalization-related competence protein ComEC/Rec2 [Gammaproteobacteria bacterium]
MRLFAIALLTGCCGLWFVEAMPSRFLLLLTGSIAGASLFLILLAGRVNLFNFKKQLEQKQTAEKDILVGQKAARDSLLITGHSLKSQSTLAHSTKSQFSLLIPIVDVFTANRYLIQRLFTFGLIAICGFCYAALIVSEQLSHRLPVSSERLSIQVTGQVCSPVRQTAESISLIVCSIEHEASKFKTSPLRRIQLSAFYLAAIPEPGERYVFDVRLKTPYSLRNPGVFDFERYALINQIDAVGYFRNFQVLADAGNISSEKSNNPSQVTYNQDNLSFEDRFSQFRLQKMEDFSNKISITQFPGWHMALTFGERHLLSNLQRELLIESGTAHLIAISGLHIGLVFLWTLFLVRLLWSRSGYLISLLPSHIAGQIAGLLFAASFAFLSGFDLPSQRALIAIAVYCFAQYWLLNWSPIQLLSCTVSIMLVIQPMSVLSEGFWLSVIAVCFIFVVVSSQKNRTIVFWLKLQCLLSACMSLFGGLFFGVLSLNAFLTNLFAIPIISFWVLPLDILALLNHFLEGVGSSNQLTSFLLWLSDLGITIVETGLLFFTNKIPAIDISSFHAAIGLLAIMGTYLAWIVRNKILNVVFALQIVTLLIAQVASNPGHSLNLQFLDVGQGSSIIGSISHDDGEFNFIYDTGFANDNYSAVEAVIKPVLTGERIKQIDLLLLSHNNQDHSGNFSELVKSFSVERLVAGEPEAHQVRLESEWMHNSFSQGWFDSKKLNKVEPCFGEIVINRDIKLIWFSANSIYKQQTSRHSDERLFDGNNASCLLRLEYFEHSVLLTGDIEKEAERYLIEHAAELLPADIMLIPHHGSLTSSSWSFIAQILPRLSIVNSGYLNRFRHPRDEVLERYSEFNAQVLNTAEHGRIEVVLKPDELPYTSRFRDTNHHFWNH